MRRKFCQARIAGRAGLWMLLAMGSLLLSAPSPARADGGASAVVLTYIKAEAISIARQLGDWEISYGPIVDPSSGRFEMTFKNVVRTSFGGKQTTWVDVKGNLRTGTFDVAGRGNSIASWMTDFVRNHIARHIQRWRGTFAQESPPTGGGGNPNTGGPPPGTGQFGGIAVKNDYGAWVNIHLFHPQAANRIFETYKFDGRQHSMLSGKDKRNITIGGDWLIQVEFGNGVKSPVRRVQSIGTFQSGTWQVVATRIFKG